MLSGPGQETNSSAGVRAKQDEEVIPSFPAVIGYIGGLHRHIDFDLISEMAAYDLGGHGCFGTISSIGGNAARTRYLHLLGPKPHELLVHYLRLLMFA